MQAEQIAKALGNAKRVGKGWLASCPLPTHGQGHGDKNPSLSISDGEDGKPLFKCHSGCDQHQLFHAIRDYGLLPEIEKRDPLASIKPLPALTPQVLEHEWVYVDEDGEPLYVKQRFKTQSAKGKDYRLVEVTYKNKSFQDKVETKKHNEFGDKTVFETLKNAQAGDEFTIEREKDGNGYWQWIGISVGAVVPTTSIKSSGNPVPAKTTGGGGNWETSEERAKRQVYIVRQSSLGHAIETLKTDKKNPSADEVISLAKVYEDYVFGVNLDADVSNKLPQIDDEDMPY